MAKIKVLNLYAGIGGNRKLWENVEVTAVEIEPKIAKIYQENFPEDKVVIEDAHEFLLQHFDEFDFIWSSPPCPSHSRIRKSFSGVDKQNPPIFPDMKLYEEILFLKHYFKGNWVVENVRSFYKPLIIPYESGRHYFWSNFFINGLKLKSRKHYGEVEELEKLKGFKLDGHEDINKIKALRNCVEPEIALKIFNMAENKMQKRLFEDEKV